MTDQRPGSIVEALRRIGSHEALRAAVEIKSSPLPLGALHLRGLGLTASSLASIAKAIKLGESRGTCQLTSISFSYNPIMGDEAITLLMDSLPLQLRQLGLVDCGISDSGAEAILQWLHARPQLTMLCMEQNPISDGMKSRFNAIGLSRPSLLLDI